VKYTLLHTRLFPYQKAYAKIATETGAPILRMLPLHFPEDPKTYSRNWEYLFGEWLLVAPVYEQGVTSREVYLPAGTWVDYWTNDTIQGPRTITADAPVESIPVYARAGAIIPMLDASIETLWPTDNPDVVDQEDVADLLWIDAYPQGASSFAMADGTQIAMAETDAGFSLAITGASIERSYSIRAVPAAMGRRDRPTGVTGPTGVLPMIASYEAWDAEAFGWYYDSAAGNLWVRDRFEAGTIEVVF
jgi:alpha-D-xyloside xylohydrolase